MIKSNSINKVQEFLENKPGYLKWGNNKIAERFNYDINDVIEAKKNIRTINLQSVTDELNIPLEDVNHYWCKTDKYSFHVQKPKVAPEDQFKSILDECRTSLEKIEYTPKLGGRESCAVINIYDVHLDKRDVDHPSDGKIQIDTLSTQILEGFYEMLEMVKINNPGYFIFPVGNDLFTTNGFMKTTKKGTPQDPVTNHEYTFRRGLHLIRLMINELSKYGNVFIPIIYGNHDRDASWYLGVALEVLYENNDNVVVNNDKRARKYTKFGKNLFGFGHGDLEKKNINKLPLIMATQEPQLWADTKYRVFYLGDVHHKEEFKFFRTKDAAGCTVQFLRSVGITDQWHDDSMFVGVPRTMESSVWDIERGQIANYTINIE